jgi:hypothetical protein
LRAEGRPHDVQLNEVWYPGVKEFWTKCTTGRIFDPILGIKAVVIHATAGDSSEGAVSVMRDGTASFHWLVPDENEPEHKHLVCGPAPQRPGPHGMSVMTKAIQTLMPVPIR